MDPQLRITVASERAYPTPYAASPLLPLLLLSLASQKHSPKTSAKFKDEYDYIIVGAGSAGSVLASRLTEMPCVSVLLLEAGKSPPKMTDIPAIARSYVNTDIDWKFVTAPQRYTAAGHIGRRIPWPSGKCVGGSGIWNAMLYVRGNRRNYDEWEELGAEGWSYDDVLPYFKKLENNTDPDFLANGYHGSDGPVTVSRPAYNPGSKLAAIDAVLDEGYEFVDPNSDEQVGFYDYQANIRDGQRCSAAKAYLVPAENRTNLDILTRAVVRKVIIENKRAVGVEFLYGGSVRKVRARREVIVSAGTTKTPQVLMLSGIGPMSELKRHKIPLVADLPVGLNFQDHPAVFLIYELDGRLSRFDEEIRSKRNVKEYIDHKTGPLTSCEGFQLMSFLPNPDSCDKQIPDHSVYLIDFTQILVLQIGLRLEVLTRLAAASLNKTILTCVSQLMHPYSRGTISLQSKDPLASPVIDPNYFSDPRDVKDMVEGLKTCKKLMSNRYMKKIGAKPLDVVFPGCEEFVNDEDLYLGCLTRTLTFTTSHEVGTARMGDSKDPRAVVDPQLRVKGVKGLRVVDASVMPTIPWGNTNTPTTMVAEKAADMIKSTISCNEEYEDHY